MKKTLAFILASAMMLSLAACGAKEEAPAAAEEKPAASDSAAKEEAPKEEAKEEAPAAADITIGYATKSSSSPFWVENIEGAKKAAEELGIKLDVIGPPVENDVSGQIAVLEDMLTSGVNAICVAPCGSVGVADVVAKAMDKGVPVVAVGDPIDGAEITSMVSTDNYVAGSMGAKFIGEQIGGEGKVIIVNGMIAQGGGKGRRDGFVDYMNETYGDAVTIVEVTADWDDQKALTGFEAAYAANEDMVGGYCAWDGGALQMHKVLTEAGRDDVALCGFDCYDTALQLMADGDPLFRGDIAQDPVKMGYESVMTAYKAINGESVEANIDTGTIFVTADNVADYAAEHGVALK